MGSQAKVAVVTGGGSGIGKAVALALAQEGYSVVVAAAGQRPLRLRGQKGRTLAHECSL